MNKEFKATLAAHIATINAIQHEFNNSNRTMEDALRSANATVQAELTAYDEMGNPVLNF